MKKAIKINLSGYIFHIDKDAYFLLQNYLDRVVNMEKNLVEVKR